MVAPYLLTAQIERPDRLVYLSSGMHTGGDPGLDDLQERLIDYLRDVTGIAIPWSARRAGPPGP